MLWCWPKSLLLIYLPLKFQKICWWRQPAPCATVTIPQAAAAWVWVRSSGWQQDRIKQNRSCTKALPLLCAHAIDLKSDPTDPGGRTPDILQLLLVGLLNSELSCGDYGWDFFKLLSEWLCSRNEPLGYPVPSQLPWLWKGKKPKPVFCTHCDFLNIIIPLGLFWFYMISHFPKFSLLPLNITVNPFTHLQLGKSAFCLTLCDKPTLKMLFSLPLAF